MKQNRLSTRSLFVFFDCSVAASREICAQSFGNTFTAKGVKYVCYFTKVVLSFGSLEKNSS
jgi:hypothetical protein